MSEVVIVKPQDNIKIFLSDNEAKKLIALLDLFDIDYKLEAKDES